MVSVAFSSAFHDASAGCDSLNFHTFELALKDVDGDTSDAADPAEERAGLAEPSKLARRGSVFMVSTPPATPEAAADGLEGEQHIHHHHHHHQQQQQQQAEPPAPAPASSSLAGKPATAMYRQTSAHRLFRAAPPEPKRQQWKVCEETPLAGGGGAGACGVGCSHGFSPMRSRGVGQSMHGPSAGGGGMPYGFDGGRHGEHHNQPMVCVVVPAQRAAALGLAPHPPHGLHSTGKCTSRGTAPCDGHISSLAQSSAASGGGGGHPGYASHTRSHSQPISHGGGSGGGGGGGYGHHGGSPHGNFDHHHSGAAVGTPHHLSVSPSHHVSPSSSHHFSPSSGHHISPCSGHRVSPSAGRSYGGPPAMHMPPMPRERQGRAEPRDYPAGASGSGGNSPSFGEYERSSQSESHLHSPYALPEWGYDDAGGSGAGRAVGGAMATAHGVVRSQSPPPMVRSRNGGGAPRPPSASPRAYDGHYSSTRYNGRGGFDGFSVAGIGGASGGVATRRRSESSAMVGRSSIQQDALAAAASYYYAVDDMGKDDVAYSRDRRGGGSRGPASRLP